MRHTAGQDEERARLLLDTLHVLGASTDFGVLLERIAAGIASALGASYCGIFLSDSKDSGFRLRRAVGGRATGPDLQNLIQRRLDPQADSIVARIMSSKASVTCSKGETLIGNRTLASLGLGTAVVVPILSAEDVSGLALGLLGKGNVVSPEGLEMAEAIASAVTPTLELHRIKEEWKRSSAERDAFWHMTSSVLGETDFQRALELVCREARHLTGAGGGAVLLPEETGELHVAVSVGDGADWSDELLFQAMTAKPCTVPAEPVILHDLSKRLVIPKAELIRTVAIVPLCVHGKSIGVLQLVNPRKGLQKDALRAVTQLADRVAVVIEHFQLHEKRERMMILEERHRVARELHDSVTQSIYAVTVFAEAGARLLDQERVSEATHTLRELRDAALRALREMRALIFELHPPDFDKMDLAEALQARLVAVEGRVGLETKFYCSTLPKLSQDVTEGLYRIAQEALNNSMKHAQASQITVRLTKSSKGVRLEVSDDGVGFELGDRIPEGRLGLGIMEERAASINGTMDIETSPGKGTSVRVDVPVQGKKAGSGELRGGEKNPLP